MRHLALAKVLLIAVLVLFFLILVVSRAYSQNPGQPADREQTRIVLQKLIDNDLIGMGILLGDPIDPSSFNLMLNGQNCGSIAVRAVGEVIWLESLIISPPAAVIKPSVSATSLRAKMYRFFGNGQTGWHDGMITVSVDRRDVLVQRSTRNDDGLVIQFSYGNWYPTQFFDLKIITWPPPQ